MRDWALCVIWALSPIRIVFKKKGKILRIILAEREGAMPPVAPPVTTPMIHYHFLIVKTHQHGRLYQHHLFRFTPKVGPNEKMAPPSRAKGGAMTPVALPPPCGRPVPRTSTYRSGPYESRQEKTDLPKTKLCCQTGPSATSNYRGMLYVTTGTGPTEAHQDGPLQKETTARADPRQHPTTGAGHT